MTYKLIKSLLESSHLAMPSSESFPLGAATAPKPSWSTWEAGNGDGGGGKKRPDVFYSRPDDQWASCWDRYKPSLLLKETEKDEMLPSSGSFGKSSRTVHYTGE